MIEHVDEIEEIDLPAAPSAPDLPDLVYTAAQAARILKVPVGKVYQLVREGHLGATYISSRNFRIPRSALLEFIKWGFSSAVKTLTPGRSATTSLSAKGNAGGVSRSRSAARKRRL